MSGTLYIVSTPIGNLEDLTIRALRLLREVDVIAAEDTRHTRKLLSHYGITGRLVSYWGAREKSKAEQVISLLKQNRDVALVSDAGTPGLSDPGEVLIHRAIVEGMEVVPVPGPSAVLAALPLSGFSSRNFVFLGFVPAKKTEREIYFEALALERKTAVMYESPHRIVESMSVLSGIMPDRRVALCHELTKLNESVIRGTAMEALSILRDSKVAGEYVIVVEGARREEMSMDEALREVEVLMRSGKGRKEAAKLVARDYAVSSKSLYDASLGSRDENK